MTEPMTIDLHAHIHVPEADALIDESQTYLKNPYLRWGGKAAYVNASLFPELMPKLLDLDSRLAHMDQRGVDVQAVSIWPAKYHYWVPGKIGREIAKIQNDSIIQTVHTAPDRLVALATLPMQDPEGAVLEMQRVARMGFKGVSINPSAEGRDYDEDVYREFWHCAEELDLLVVLHPNGFSHGTRLREYYLINSIGNPLETTIALSRLLLSGLLDRHPKLRLLAVHGGGYLPLYAERIDHAYSFRAEVSSTALEPPSRYLNRLYFDSIVHGDGLQRLVDRVGADRVVIGSDYPFGMGDDDPVTRINALTGISDQERRLLLGETAARLLGIDVAEYQAGKESGRRPHLARG